MVHSFSYDIDVSFSSIVDFTQKLIDNFIFFLYKSMLLNVNEILDILRRYICLLSIYSYIQYGFLSKRFFLSVM